MQNDVPTVNHLQELLRVGYYDVGTAITALASYPVWRQETITKLGMLLRCDFDRPLQDVKRYVGVVRDLKQMDKDFSEAKTFALIIRMGLFNLFLSDLEYLRQGNKSAWQDVIKRLGNSSLNTHDGNRFELKVMGSLVKKSVAFTKRESPDLEIHHRGATVLAEITSIKTSAGPSHKDLIYKIIGSINQKSAKGYINLATALFLDITNLHHSSIGGFVTEWSKLDQCCQAINASSIGSVILMTTLADPKSNSVETVFKRLDNNSIHDNLKDFLNTYYPFGDYYKEGFYRLQRL